MSPPNTSVTTQSAPKPASTEGVTNKTQHSPLAVRGYAAAAKMLGLSERTVWSLVKRNALPHHRCGTAVLFVPDELAAWLDAGCPTEPGSAVKVRGLLRKRGHS
jgi:excisionase family DNA binding protein